MRTAARINWLWIAPVLSLLPSMTAAPAAAPLASASTSSATGAAPATVDDLRWLSGSWSGTKDGVRSEEHWSAPDGDLLLGMHRDVKDGRAIGFEFLRIQVHEGALTYLAQPGGRPATPFRLKESGGRRVVFENPANDFPQRILYWQTQPGELHARVEGTIDGKPAHEEWTWTRSAPAP